jgi:hypothetical protein
MERWTLLARFLQVAATVVVAVLAIWGERWRYKFSPPKLILNLRRRETRVELVNGVKHRYVHIEVTNRNEWFPAKNVVVFLTKIERLNHDGLWKTSYDTGPIPMKWQFSSYGVARRDIGPMKYCDLGCLIQNQGFKIEVEFAPAEFKQVLPANDRVRIHLIAEADNATSSLLVVEVNWDGQWSDIDAASMKHLAVSPVS